MPTRKKMNIDHHTIHAIGLQDYKIAPPRSFCKRPSTLGKGARMGLFTRREIAANTIIGEYKGESVNSQNSTYCTAEDYAYVFATSHGFIDAKAVYSQVKYINHQAGTKANVISRELHVNGRIFILTKRHISANEELFLDYGDGYFWNLPPTIWELTLYQCELLPDLLGRSLYEKTFIYM